MKPFGAAIGRPRARQTWLASLWLSCLVCACTAPLRPGKNGRLELPTPATEYSTEARSGGVAGGDAARRAQALLERELSARNDHAEPDGRLAAAAAFLIEGIYAGRPTPMQTQMEAASWRYGFAGALFGFAAFNLQQVDAERTLQALIATVPKNRAVTRYGVIAGRDDDVAFLLGSVEVSLDDFPRSLAPASRLKLEGEAASSYDRASVFVTSPDGKVRERRMDSRQIDATIEVPQTGIYHVEVMGYGAGGPVVLLNVPVSVGVSETSSSSADDLGNVDPSLTTEAAEARLLELLNRARKETGLGAVQPDATLRAVALAHSQEMAQKGFFGHVSPTTGSPQDRGLRAGLRASKLGECVSSAYSPEGAHVGLLRSPAHRAAMLDPEFTQVGIGVAFREQASGARALLATLFFGRLPAPEQARLTAAQVAQAIQAYRAARNLPKLLMDPVLTASASAGVQALQTVDAETQERAAARARTELQVQVNRTKKNRLVCFVSMDIMEKSQLAEQPLLLRPDLAAFGVGATVLESEKGPSLALFFALEGAAGKPFDCR